jgi:hypothetical protein
MYLSPIQKGIQSAHLTHDLFVKYKDYADVEMKTTLFDWAENHKTMIVLNGGYSSTLEDLHLSLCDSRNPYPFTHFKESDEALGGALTCVGIVLPEKIYETAALIRKDPTLIEMITNDGFVSAVYTGADEDWSFNGFELKLIQELNNYSLA